MWYIDMVTALAERACKAHKKREISLFVEYFFNLLEVHLYDKDELSPLAAVGLVSDLFLVVLINETMTLSAFAKHCLGLAILHIKAAEDYRVDIVDFIPIIKNPVVHDALMLDKEIGDLCIDFLMQHFTKSTRKFVMLLGPRRIPDPVHIKLLGHIELQLFALLEHQVSKNINLFSNVFNYLFPHVKNRLKTVSSLSSFLTYYQQEYAEFNEPNLSLDFNQFIIKLDKIKHELSLEVFPNISAILSNYVERGKSWSRFLFWADSLHCQYTKPVELIISEINNKQHKDVDSIVERLEAIKISSPDDELIGIIDFLKERYLNVNDSFAYV